MLYCIVEKLDGAIFAIYGPYTSRARANADLYHRFDQVKETPISRVTLVVNQLQALPAAPSPEIPL
jgi:hypothetical protein